MTPPAMDTTNVDPAAAGWAIDDLVIRLRVLGSERVFDLATSDRWLLGSSPGCSLRLDDPSGRVSRCHAMASREGELWALADLGSTNGLRVNRERRRFVELAPGDEVELGGLTLIAESCRSMELHELLQRWLGWSTSRWRGEQALDRAANGTLYLDARGLRRGFRTALANLRSLDMRVRLVACVDSAKAAVDLAAVISRIAMLSIPPVTERKDEIERLLEAYGSDAVAALGASWLGLLPGDAELVLDSGIATHDELEEFARRLVALRNWGISGGAVRLGITHSALSRWAFRWRIPT